MRYEQFQHLARLYVVGALELDELTEFEEGMRLYGEIAEEYLKECRRMEAALTLSLRRSAPRSDAKQSLLEAIRRR
jgi:hypothetical protein